LSYVRVSSSVFCYFNDDDDDDDDKKKNRLPKVRENNKLMHFKKDRK